MVKQCALTKNVGLCFATPRREFHMLNARIEPACTARELWQTHLARRATMPVALEFPR